MPRTHPPATKHMCRRRVLVLGLVLVGLLAGGYWLYTRPRRMTPGDEIIEASARLLMHDGLEALDARNDPEAAIDEFRKVLALDPKHPAAMYQLARALDRAGRGIEARAVWTRVLVLAQLAGDRQTEQGVRARLAEADVVTETGMMQAGLEALYQRRDPVAAAVEFRRLLARDPTHYKAMFQLARALDLAGEPAEACRLWRKVLRMAEDARDKPTADTAAARLGQCPQADSEGRRLSLSPHRARPHEVAPR
jgi:tetratricopeptide (TPR) repeat protein